MYLSSVGAQHPLDTGAIRKLYDMEKAFKKLSLPTASIRAAWFMENFVGQLAAVASGSPLMSFVDPPSKKIPMIAGVILVNWARNCCNRTGLDIGWLNWKVRAGTAWRTQLWYLGTICTKKYR